MVQRDILIYNTRTHVLLNYRLDLPIMQVKDGENYISILIGFSD